jgi:ABC-type enterochelin transport system permease subunit
MRWRAFIIALLLIVIALLATILWLQVHAHPIWIPGEKDAEGVEYKDFISILLTALAVMIALATILLAGLALWGFGALKDEARSVAERVAKETAEPVAARAARDMVDFSRDILYGQETPDDVSVRGETDER